MKKLGYDVTVLEARERPRGRNFTGRNGTRVEFTDGTVQTIHWKEGNHQNLGPARLPSTHWTMLEYARELGVKLEVEINTSRSALLQNDHVNGGRAIPQRKAVNDARGIVAELLNKCAANGALDTLVSKTDRERMNDFLTKYGTLDASGAYKGSPCEAVALDVAILRALPPLPASWFISGLVYNVATGLVEVVVPPAPLRNA